MWWSRFAHPTAHAWQADKPPLRLVEQERRKDDYDPKALACYGLLIRHGVMGRDEQGYDQMLLRFVQGQPVSGVTIEFLRWCSERLAAAGRRALLLIWDNASWHISKAVRSWLREHNQRVKQGHPGVRIVLCLLPSKSPWLNRIERKWVHGKRAIVEPTRSLSAHELTERICGYYGCSHEPYLVQPQMAA